MEVAIPLVHPEDLARELEHEHRVGENGELPARGRRDEGGRPEAAHRVTVTTPWTSDCRRPALLTVAREVSLEDQMTLGVMSPVLESE